MLAQSLRTRSGNFVIALLLIHSVGAEQILVYDREPNDRFEGWNKLMIKHISSSKCRDLPQPLLPLQYHYPGR